MWGRKYRGRNTAQTGDTQDASLKEALRQIRIESAERTSVVLEMRDAEITRLELLNETLDPVFAEIPPDVEMFDRAISRGDVPRLWIDIVAYVVMGRDKRLYRFVQDTRYGRKILLESSEVEPVTDAITRYVAARLIERERALATDALFTVRAEPRRRWWRGLLLFVLGALAGIAALVIAALWQGAN